MKNYLSAIVTIFQRRIKKKEEQEEKKRANQRIYCVFEQQKYN